VAGRRLVRSTLLDRQIFEEILACELNLPSLENKLQARNALSIWRFNIGSALAFLRFWKAARSQRKLRGPRQAAGSKRLNIMRCSERAGAAAAAVAGRGRKADAHSRAKHATGRAELFRQLASLNWKSQYCLCAMILSTYRYGLCCLMLRRIILCNYGFIFIIPEWKW